MEIGIDIRTLMDRRFSGVSLYTYELVKAILAIDQRNNYKLFYNSATAPKTMPEFKAENVSLVHTKWPNKIFNYLLQKSLRWPKIDRLLGVDLFFMPHINFISLSKKCRKVITVHDLSFLRYPSYFSVRKNLWHKLINTRKLLKQFDTIVAVSANTKKDIMELIGIAAGRIKVIYSGSSDRYRRVTDGAVLAAVKKKYDLPEKFILFLGTIEPRKNVLGLLAAYELMLKTNKHLGSFNLVIAGGHGWKSKEVLSRWQNSKVKNKIKFPGYIDEEDKAALYSLASLFVYPSFYEGFGFPPLEATSCGCPVIASASSSLPEIIGDRATLVDPYNFAEISRAMVFGLESDGTQFGIKKVSDAKQIDFNWPKAANAYLEVFNRN